jgi:hypothetical protein
MRCPKQLQSRAALFILLLCALATFAGGAIYLLASSSSSGSPDSALPRCWLLPGGRDSDCFKVLPCPPDAPAPCHLQAIAAHWLQIRTGVLHATLHYIQAVSTSATDLTYSAGSRKYSLSVTCLWQGQQPM